MQNINNIGVTSILYVSRVAPHILINVCTKTQSAHVHACMQMSYRNAKKKDYSKINLSELAGGRGHNLGPKPSLANQHQYSN